MEQLSCCIVYRPKATEKKGTLTHTFTYVCYGVNHGPLHIVSKLQHGVQLAGAAASFSKAELKNKRIHCPMPFHILLPESTIAWSIQHLTCL